jgi:hypothetical protein
MRFQALTGLWGRYSRRWCCLLLTLSALPAMRAQELLPAEPVASAQALPPAASAGTGESYIPLTRHERWHGFLHETFLGTQPALQIAGTALLDHLGHAPTQWGVGLHGYAHRLEDRFYSAMITGGVQDSLAAVLHYDTRYLRAHDRRAARRVSHALERTLITYNEMGERVLDVPGLAGIYAGTMIPMEWHPRGYSAWHQGIQEGNFGVMFQAGTNVIKEFRPDLERIFSRKAAN